MPSWATFSLLFLAFSPAHAAIASWWNGIGHQILLQNETTGKLHYSRCNLWDSPEYSPTDAAMPLTYVPKMGTPLAGTGYYDETTTL